MLNVDLDIDVVRRVLEVTEIKTVPDVPLSHPFVERLIGTIRREFLDHIPFWTSRDLERKLLSFKNYDNLTRSHRSLDGNTPIPMPKLRVRPESISWKSDCRGLCQLPVAA